MDVLLELGSDVARLWATYAPTYLHGEKNTRILAVVATIFGCVIGLLCGVLNTIPYASSDNAFKKFFLKLIRALVRIYVEVFRGTPMWLQAVFIY